MGFCKPGDPCFNYQLGTVDSARILAWQQEALVTAAECGFDIPAFGNICQQVRDCVTGSTGGGGTFTGNTSGDCIQELWVSVISGCSPVIMGPSVGIGTHTPTGPFEVKDYISFNPDDYTTRIGYNAGQNWEVTSDGNTMVGQAAGGTGTWNAAQNNTAVGYNAATFLSEGDQNTLVGAAASGTLSTGSNNTSVGYVAGYSLSTDSNNTAIGSGSHYNPYAGGDAGVDAFNTAVGYRSMYYPNRGYKNVAIGAHSLEGTNVFDIGNQGAVAVGYKALNASRTGDYNIAIGYQAADNITTGDYNISIGPDADPVSATADYQMNIAGIIYGRDIDGSSSINTIGIGTTTPNEKLTVVGAVSATSKLYFSEIDGGTF